MTFFSHRPGFSNFPSLLPDFPDLFFSFRFYLVRYQISYTILSSQEKHLFSILAAEKHLFYSFHTFAHTSDNTTSQNNIGGTNAWAVPTSNFGGTVPQSR